MEEQQWQPEEIRTLGRLEETLPTVKKVSGDDLYYMANGRCRKDNDATLSLEDKCFEHHALQAHWRTKA